MDVDMALTFFVIENLWESKIIFFGSDEGFVCVDFLQKLCERKFGSILIFIGVWRR